MCSFIMSFASIFYSRNISIDIHVHLRNTIFMYLQVFEYKLPAPYTSQECKTNISCTSPANVFKIRDVKR